jgi:hypothetical protein
MAVVNPDKETIGVVTAGERLAKLRGVYLVARFRCRMDVPSAHDPVRHLAITEKEAATLAWRGLACVSDDLVPQFCRQEQSGAFDQSPPAIAGMTMTSLPSGTAAPLPPRARASSSPM